MKHSDKTENKHVCEYCGEKFLYPYLLEAHHVIIPLLKAKFQQLWDRERFLLCTLGLCTRTKMLPFSKTSLVANSTSPFCPKNEKVGFVFKKKK